MKKEQLYPKTARMAICNPVITVTEKIDGANLCIFKKYGELYFAQRKTILSFEELNDKNKNTTYKGLIEWAHENFDSLDGLREDAAICGEWLGMGQIKYPKETFDKKFYMFATATVSPESTLYDFRYTQKFFESSFKDNEIPNCIGMVPIVKEYVFVPGVENLDLLYEKYSRTVNRPVEGFVVHFDGAILKYVRMKRGKLQEHHS